MQGQRMRPDLPARHQGRVRAAPSEGWQGRQTTPYAWASGVAVRVCSSPPLRFWNRRPVSFLQRGRDPTQGAVLRVWLEDHVHAALSQRILLVDVAVAQRYAKLEVPDSCSDRDALIAATAFVHGMTVVTRNGAHCEPIGVGALKPSAAVRRRLPIIPPCIPESRQSAPKC
jgi:hypothetical protein